ncbi:helix-turn-helix domain-containing protein [Burkholderia contaminans]|uniref:helix-turn-helix domain-containing protein n=1 Tax=Burkholderia contaminans TaxID=488447 RepID=UPI002D7FA4A0|nr:helix-turn-helix transcriptional regulator [Burkholderia contaminans]
MKKKEELASLAATFVATIKHLQQEAGVNDSELSRAIDLDRGTLSRLLSGETIDPRLSTISAIARFFAVPMSSLFGEESRGFVPVYEQRSLRDARKVSAAPRHGQLWIRVSNANSSRFAIALAPQEPHRTASAQCHPCHRRLCFS